MRNAADIPSRKGRLSWFSFLAQYSLYKYSSLIKVIIYLYYLSVFISYPIYIILSQLYRILQLFHIPLD